MDPFSIRELTQWLNITSQQANVLLTIHKLEAGREKTSPKNIATRYKKDHDTYIQKPNMFVILKTLMEKDLIRRRELSDYRIEFDGIAAALHRHRDGLRDELARIERIAPDIEAYFRRLAPRGSRPDVATLAYDDFYEHLSRRLAAAKTLLSASSFPLPAYTPQVAAGLGKTDLHQILTSRCFADETLALRYVSDLDVDYLFNHCFRALGDPTKAYREAGLILDQLKSQTDTQKQLSVHVIDDLAGFDVSIPLDDEPRDFYLVTRDEHRDIAGAIYIKNAETADAHITQFFQRYDYADDLAGKQGTAIISEKHQELNHKYGGLAEDR